LVVVLVVYDISDDSVRGRVSSKLLTLGFNRIQRSAYVRRGTSGTARYVFRVVKSLIDLSTDRLLVIPIPDRVYDTSLSVGPKFVGDYRGGKFLI